MLSDEKKLFFQSYLDRLEYNTKGTLDLGNDELVDVHDEVRGVVYDRTSNQMGEYGYTGESMEVKMADHRGESLFAHPPTATDVIQSKMGNCFFLCAIGDMVAENPESVTGMFQEYGDNVIVRLWHHDQKNADADPKPVYILIDKVVEEKSNKGALWVSLLCKAFCCYNRLYPDNMHTERMGDLGTAIQNQHRWYSSGKKVIDYGYFSGGGLTSNVYPILTGRKKEPAMSLRGTALEAETASHMVKLAYQKEHTKEERTRMEQDNSFLGQDVAVFSVQGHGEAVYIKELCGELLQKREADRKDLFDDIKAYKKAYADLMAKQKNLKAKYNENIPDSENFAWLQENQELTNEKIRLKRKYRSFMGIPDTQYRPDWMDEKKEFDETVETVNADRADKIFLVVFSKLSEALTSAAETYVQNRLHWNNQKDFFRMVTNVLNQGDVKQGALNKHTYQLSWCAEQLGYEKKDTDVVFQKLLQYAAKTNEIAAAKYDGLKDDAENQVFTGVYSEYALSVFDKINELKGQGYPVSVGGRVGAGEKYDNGETKEAGVLGKHGYSVLGTTEVLYEGKTIKMVRLRNPWGHYSTDYLKDTKTGKVEAVTNEENGGEFLCELTHFIKSFTELFTTK